MPPAKIELTDDQRDELETLAKVLTQDQCAQYFGISKSTFKRILSEDEAARLAYDRGRAETLFLIGESLIGKALKGDTASQIFYLKTQGGWRETNRLELDVPPEAKTLADFYADLSKGQDEADT